MKHLKYLVIALALIAGPTQAASFYKCQSNTGEVNVIDFGSYWKMEEFESLPIQHTETEAGVITYVAVDANFGYVKTRSSEGVTFEVADKKSYKTIILAENCVKR